MKMVEQEVTLLIRTPAEGILGTRAVPSEWRWPVLIEEENVKVVGSTPARVVEVADEEG